MGTDDRGPRLVLPGDHVVDRSPDRRALLVLAAVVVLVIVVLGLARRDGGGADAESPATSATPPPSAPRTTTTPTTTAPPPSTTGPAAVPAPRPVAGVTLEPDEEPLGGRIALAPWPDGDEAADEPVWIIDGPRLVSRFDLPTRPGDWPYPMLFGADGLGLVAEGATIVLGDEATAIDALELEEPSRYLVPAGTAGEVWVVHDDFDLTLLTADGGRRRVETPAETGWVLTGVADGVMVLAAEADEPWPFPRYLPAGGEPIELTAVTDPQAHVIGASGDLLAVSEPGPQVVVVDVRADERVAEIPLDRSVSRACFSADRAHLAVGDFAGDTPISIIDLATGWQIPRWPVDHFGDMAWASDDELVVTDGARLARFDADGGGGLIATLSGPTWRSGTSATAWWIASEAAPC